MSAPAIGETVRDSATGRVGVVIGHAGPRYRLRPLNGGGKWDAEPGNLSPAAQSDALSADVVEANSRTRWGV